MALRTAAKCGLLLLALVGPASSLAAPSIFCCNNEAGRQVCGDVLPSACYGRAYRELGYTGRTARTVEAPLTGEQRVQRAADEEDAVRAGQRRAALQPTQARAGPGLADLAQLREGKGAGR